VKAVSRKAQKNANKVKRKVAGKKAPARKAPARKTAAARKRK
jgi:hypothetical protein